MKPYFFFILFLIVLSSMVYSTTISGGDFVVDIDMADNSQIQGGSFNVDIAQGIFINDIFISTDTIITPPSPPSSGGGGFVASEVPFNFINRNIKNNSYIHINQRTDNIIRFTVSINQSQQDDNITLFYSINYGNYQTRRMSYNNKGSFTTELVFNTNNPDNLQRYDMLYNIKQGDILTYYVEGRRINKFIRTPDYDFEIYVWQEIKILTRFFNLTKDILLYLLLIPIIILIFIFIAYKKTVDRKVK